ncbi:MAG: hypothetical protein WAT71_13865 [Ignavibacteria bacterium]
MHKSSVLEIIRTFTPKELIKFEDFVNSPYHNKNKNVVSLFLEIKKFAPDFKDDNLDKEKVWGKIFPEKEYNYGILKNLIHDLDKLCETFLLLEQYLYDDTRKGFDLINIVFQRDIPKLTISKLNSFERNFQMTPVRGNFNNYLYYGTHIYHIKSMCILFYGLNQDLQNAINKSCEFTLYYFMHCASVYATEPTDFKLDNRNPKEENILVTFLKSLDENHIMDDLFSDIGSRSDNLSKIVCCFYFKYKCFRNNADAVYYYKFKNHLKENISIFTLEQLNNFYLELSYCLHYVYISSLEEKNREKFEILKFRIENKIFINLNGIIPDGHLARSIEIACNVKEIDFAENFLTEYIEKVPEEFRENILNFSLSTISFAKSDYSQSLIHLSKIQKEVELLKYLLRNLHMKIYYELNDYESFISSYDAFKHYIKRKKILDHEKGLAISKFCDHIKILFKLREKFNEFELKQLKVDVNETRFLNHTWLINKIDELELANKKELKIRN